MKRMLLLILLFCLVGVFGDQDLKSVLVRESNFITLKSGLTEMMDDDMIQWRFGSENTLIAEINVKADSFTVYDDVLSGMFRNKLKVDHQTGDLTIKDTRMSHNGIYQLCVNNVSKAFSLTVRGTSRFRHEVTLLVQKGKTATLKSAVDEILDNDLIYWRFRSILIAELNKRTDSVTLYDDVLGGRFKDRLKLDHQTGDLTITDITNEHAGRYELRIVLRRIDFYLRIYDTDETSVMEGDSVTLSSGLTEMEHPHMWWKFGDKICLIAEVNVMKNISSVYDDVLDGRFRNRLKLDNNGDLTITDVTTEHAGVYEQQFDSSILIFNLSVCAHLPVPVIIRNSSQCSSYCSVVCSVVNVSAVSLSWYNESRLLSSISVSDLSISLSLPLEVKYQEKNTYSCVINNTISNHTTHLDINTLCQPCSGSVHCCGSTEAVIRLVLSTVVGVATIIILFYDIRSRRA